MPILSLSINLKMIGSKMKMLERFHRYFPDFLSLKWQSLNEEVINIKLQYRLEKKSSEAE